MFRIGIDVGGTSIKLGIIKDNQIFGKTSVKTNPSLIAESIFIGIEELIRVSKIQLNEIESIGIALPGPVKNNVLIKSPNLGLVNYKIQNEMKKFYPSIPTYCTNDANAAALAEYSNYKDKYKNACMLTLGTGIGSGIIIDGKILEGGFGFAAESGHVPSTSPNKFKCGCGAINCYETVGSANGLVRLYYENINSNANSIPEDAETIINLAKANDLYALRIVDEWAKYVAQLCVSISVIVNPSIFIIGGGVSLAGDFILEKIKKAFNDSIGFSDLKQTEFKLAQYGNDAGIIGASQLSI